MQTAFIMPDYCPFGIVAGGGLDQDIHSAASPSKDNIESSTGGKEPKEPKEPCRCRKTHTVE